MQYQEPLVHLIQTFEQRLSQRAAEADHRARQLCALTVELMQGRPAALLAHSHIGIARRAYVFSVYGGMQNNQYQQNRHQAVYELRKQTEVMS
jgi:hypothetical protein